MWYLALFKISSFVEHFRMRNINEMRRVAINLRTISNSVEVLHLLQIDVNKFSVLVEFYGVKKD